MNIKQIRKIIFFNLFLLNIFNLFNDQSLASSFESPLLLPNTFNQILLKENKNSKRIKSRQIKDSLKIIQKLALNESAIQPRELEILSDKQYKDENVIYAEGNVLVTYKGNILQADRLTYDQLNETVKAEGNIKLVLGDQGFSAEKIYYNFKTQEGSFLKVKGLIKTKNFVKNLDLTSYEPGEISSIFQTIKKNKVLHTEDGVNNWIFYSDELTVERDQWFAKKAFFTNDLLQTSQVKFEINSLKVIPKKDAIKISSNISYLIFEDTLPIPFWFGNRTLKKSNDGFLFEFTSKWYLGLDNVDKDGYFIGRKLEPINISDDFVLNLEPQLLIQRSLKGYTQSFVKKNDPVTANKSRRDVSFTDYFGLSSDLKGKINSWDLNIKKQLNSFDKDKFLDALRIKFNLSKDIEFLNSTWKKNFYGVYRDRIWNGSQGESEIYIGFGSKLEKVNIWVVEGIEKTEKISLGLGNFKGEGLNSENLVSGYKGSIFYSLNQKFPLVVKESENKFVDKTFNYIFEPVKQGIFIDTKVAALYSFYEGGNHQEYIGFGAGPEFIYGNFKKNFLDYTRLSLFPFYRLKSGESIFKFDEISDQFTLDMAFDQQLYGPILLKTNATLNLDGNSKNYGDFINSKISLNWKKRSYEFGVFYQPNNKAGGINFTLFGFE